LSAVSLWARSLNHLLRQNPGATNLLSQHVGQTVRFDLGITTLDAHIESDGSVVETTTSSPDAIIRATSSFLTRLPFLGRDALRHADYSGDAALLQTLDKVFRDLRWDIEAELAPLLGDMTAHRLATMGLNAMRSVRHAGQSVQTSASEYLVEEVGLIARKMDVGRFTREVDTLVDDVARLEARLIHLESNAPFV
jgi:ubiquinone biosynthesis protein UbiJ